MTTPLAKLAKSKVLVLLPDARLKKVQRFMRAHQVRFILVVCNRRVVVENLSYLYGSLRAELRIFVQ